MEDFKTFLAWRKKYKYDQLWERVRRAYEAHPLTVETHERPWGVVPKINVFKEHRARCGARVLNGPRTDQPCLRIAGEATSHMGAGWCSMHLGNGRAGNTEGFMIMAMAFADRFGITPAEALQEEVERSVHAVHWLDAKVNEAKSADDLLPDGLFGGFVEMRAKERSHLVKVATAAINANVTELIADKIRADGEKIAGVLNHALSALDLTPEQEDAAREVLARDLRAIGA